jgi:hypothetical protein
MDHGADGQTAVSVLEVDSRFRATRWFGPMVGIFPFDFRSVAKDSNGLARPSPFSSILRECPA